MHYHRPGYDRPMVGSCPTTQIKTRTAVLHITNQCFVLIVIIGYYKRRKSESPAECRMILLMLSKCYIFEMKLLVQHSYCTISVFYTSREIDTGTDTVAALAV